MESVQRFLAAKRRKNKAHGASRGAPEGNDPAPAGRKPSFRRPVTRADESRGRACQLETAWEPLSSLRDSFTFFCNYPGLTPWAKLCRRSAAGSLEGHGSCLRRKHPHLKWREREAQG